MKVLNWEKVRIQVRFTNTTDPAGFGCSKYKWPFVLGAATFPKAGSFSEVLNLVCKQQPACTCHSLCLWILLSQIIMSKECFLQISLGMMSLPGNIHRASHYRSNIQRLNQRWTRPLHGPCLSWPLWSDVYLPAHPRSCGPASHCCLWCGCGCC